MKHMGLYYMAKKSNQRFLRLQNYALAVTFLLAFCVVIIAIGLFVYVAGHG